MSYSQRPYEEGVPAEALALYRRALFEVAPRDDYAEVLALMTRAVEIAPTWPEAVCIRAAANHCMKNFDAALANFRTTAVHRPTVSSFQ